MNGKLIPRDEKKSPIEYIDEKKSPIGYIESPTCFLKNPIWILIFYFLKNINTRYRLI